jgi:hypothetical protein
MSSTIIDGVIIGGAGGAIAGITVYLVQAIHDSVSDRLDSKRVFKWLHENTENVDGKKFRSTRAIASYNNLTEDRVRFLCSHHPKIYLSTGEKEDRWSVHSRKSDKKAMAW